MLGFESLKLTIISLLVYSLEIRQKINKLQPVVLDTDNFCQVRIMTERALIWYIIRRISISICCTWFCVENKVKKHGQITVGKE